MTDELTRAMARATACPPHVSARLRRRVRSRVSDELVSRSLLSALPGSNPDAILSLRHRLDQAAPAPRRRARYWVVGASALAMAAAVLLSLPSAVPLPVSPRPMVFDAVAAGPSVLPLRTTHMGWGAIEQVASPTPGVQLTWQGEGSVSNRGKVTQVEWGFGDVHVDVEPRAGHQVAVRTREALVEVLGTVFDVQRGVGGTTIVVSRGLVKVRCAEGAVLSLRGGQRTTCKPVRPGAVLGRVLALRKAHEPVQTVLDAIAIGVRHGDPTDPAVAELLALRVFALVESGRADEAHGDVARLMAGPRSDRRDEVARLWQQLGR